MKAQFLIALRFLAGRKRARQSIASTVSLISLMGVTLGVMVPIVVLSVMMGFQEEIKTKILGVKGHIVISSTYLEKNIKNYKEVMKKIRAIPGVVSANPYIEVQGMAQFFSGFEPVLIRGVPPDYFKNDTELDQLVKIIDGKKTVDRRYQILIGSELAAKRLVDSGERINLLVTDEENLTMSSRPRSVETKIMGTFKTGLQQFDEGIVYVSLSTFEKVFRQKNVVRKIDIKVENIWNLEPVLEVLITLYGDRYRFFTWQDINYNFFKALALERSLMNFIVTLILIVAIFNVTSSQLIFIIEKKKEIGILKTIGMRPLQVAQIFLFQGFVITAMGSIIGGTLGYLISLDVMLVIQGIEYIISIANLIFYSMASWFVDMGTYQGFEIFPKGVYYLDFIPSDVSISRVLFFISMAIVLSAIVGFFPSLKAARLKPVDIMRYE